MFAGEWTGLLADRVERELKHSTTAVVIEGARAGKDERSHMHPKDEGVPKTTSTYCQYERRS